MSNNKQNINSKQKKFKINCCEVVNELRKPVNCTKLNLLRGINNKNKICNNLSEVFNKYSKSVIGQAEIIKDKETSSRKVLNWLRKYRHPPLPIVNSNEQSVKKIDRKFMPEKCEFKRQKFMKTFLDEKSVSRKNWLDSSIGTFEPKINSTPLFGHNRKNIKTNEENVNYFQKKYHNTVNLVFERCLSKNQLGVGASLEFSKQKPKRSLDIHSSPLGISMNEIFQTTPHSTHIPRLFSSVKNNIETDNRCPGSLNISTDKSFILNTETTLFDKPDHFSNCSILDFENFLKAVEPKKNSSCDMFHDSFEQAFNHNVPLDSFLEEFHDRNDQEMNNTFSFNDLSKLAKTPKVLITPNNFNNNFVKDDVNSLLESSQHFLNLLSKDVNSGILKTKRRKQRKTSDSYFSCSDDNLHQDRDNWQFDITNISKSIPYKTVWNKKLLEDTQQANTSELIQSINEDIFESPHFPYSSREMKKY